MNKTIPSNNRIVSLDIIRGFALLGILFINIPAFTIVTEGNYSAPQYSTLDMAVNTLISIFVTKKFFSIFSFLFGIGFYIFASRVEARGDNPRRRFSRRLFSLFLIGIIHAFIFWGTILPFYALIGFLLLPFYNASISTIGKWVSGISLIYLLSIVIELLIPEQQQIVAIAKTLTSDSTLIFIMFLAGFGVAKADWIRNISGMKKQIQKAQLVTLPFFIGGGIWIWVASYSNHKQLPLIIALSSIPAVIFYLCTMFSLLESKRIATALTPVGYVGRMALTNYVAQSFIGLAIMSFMNIEMASPTQTVWIAFLIFGIQILYTFIWFKFFKMGPLEKVWRYMTYGKKK
ncbi:DUF418 domain-containing protein [Bacillus cereus]|uniref:DUF418 domain-containing protein n=1 Tax=Bacillus cereus group TaxID=86661 RepID=UPI000676C7F3|nr:MULTISPECIES: DUF418 domain-containing protein [Bacillus cereus group]AKR07979.1 hypothetical protein AC241_04440 [Bacillus thuringiensis]MBZ8123701.1 DUF418 domain-containing protein [Bacillus thuringiensis]MCU7677952.1 DUF418 domain-containing protein [Bacillus thuringiensis]MDA1775098.1 DUF418 domain-containing protein [Bacillus cereus]PEM05486.1 DUF418 domain-containing protein [Bacillus cereus]